MRGRGRHLTLRSDLHAELCLINPSRRVELVAPRGLLTLADPRMGRVLVVNLRPDAGVRPGRSDRTGGESSPPA